MGYFVKMNHCKCHPETCCCNPFAVYSENSEKISTHFFKEDAENICNRLNHAELKIINENLKERLRDLENKLKISEGN